MGRQNLQGKFGFLSLRASAVAALGGIRFSEQDDQAGGREITSGTERKQAVWFRTTDSSPLAFKTRDPRSGNPELRSGNPERESFKLTGMTQSKRRRDGGTRIIGHLCQPAPVDTFIHYSNMASSLVSFYSGENEAQQGYVSSSRSHSSLVVERGP